MNRKIAIWLVTVFLLTIASLAEAQQATKIPRVGYLSSGSGKATAFRQGLRKLGYVDGQNIVIVVRGTRGKRALLADVSEFLGLPVR